jgi:hypothetical protein
MRRVVTVTASFADGSSHRCCKVALPRNGNLPWDARSGQHYGKGGTVFRRSRAALVSNRVLMTNSCRIAGLLALTTSAST